MSNKLRKKIKPHSKKETKISKNINLSISQCMIVKNEEENIRQALAYGKGIFKEQIVVDTGSIDDTVKIAEDMGATIYHYEWNDDFAAAKNFALDKATGDWIVFLDADEYLDEKNLRRLLDNIMQCQLRRMMGNEIDMIRASISNINDNGEEISRILQDRCFINDKNLRYVGKIHESIEFLDGKKFVFILAEDVIITHTGYQEHKTAKKAKRNIELLTKAIEADPNDYNSVSYLADSVNMGGDTKKAYELYFKSVENLDKISNISRRFHTLSLALSVGIQKGMASKTDIERLFDIFTKTFPDIPDPHYMVGMYYLINLDDANTAIEYFNNALRLLDSYVDKYKIFVILCDRASVLRGFANAYLRLKSYERSLESFIQYQAFNKKDTDSLEKIISIIYIISDNKLSNEERDSFLLNILKGLYDFNSEIDLLLCLKAFKSIGKKSSIASLIEDRLALL